ncbi:hypothetical protein [Barrientosiimonas endolithica]|uniref:DUF8017 domain-containing protein n=1 Tax=Barrientosiimonas endolithica TaxID=1535208 RepID=A0ABN6YL52_9MICO|nr:hypothetical protein [Barrientosiimonas endolithica]BDZ56642.1 hypothetical protein GCM10025872_02990 [Barrientosiimonas endolithica]
MSNNDGQWRGYDESAWRDQEFGHGQEQYYRGLQVPGEGPGRPEQQPASPGGPGDGRTPSPTEPRPPSGSGSGGKRGKTVALLAAGAVALAGAGVGGFVLLNRSGDGSPAVAGSSSPAAGPSSAPSAATAPTAAASTGTPTPTARNAGFRLVVDPQRGASYEVPQTHKVGGSGMVVRWTHPVTGDSSVTLRNPASGGNGFCPEQNAITSSTGFYDTSADPGSAGPATYDEMARAIAIRPDGKSYGSYPAATSTTITLSDGTKAVRSRGTVPSSKPEDPCRKYPTEVAVTSFTNPNSSRTVTLVTTRLIGSPRAVSDTVFTTMIDSIRPV